MGDKIRKGKEKSLEFEVNHSGRLFVLQIGQSIFLWVHWKMFIESKGVFFGFS